MGGGGGEGMRKAEADQAGLGYLREGFGLDAKSRENLWRI